MARFLHQLARRADGGGEGAAPAAPMLRIGARRIAARVSAQGAELQGIQDAQGREFLWQAGPAWPRRAPILFPIVGRLQGDALRAGQASWPLPQHGFARDSRFEVLAQSGSACRLLLTDGPATWDRYPFPFRLEVAYAAQDASLSIAWTVTNPGETLLPFSIGAHPAFAWPLPGAGPRSAHALEFEQDEPGPAFRISADGLLDPAPQALPMAGRSLGLREELFRDGALVLLAPASRRLRFHAPGAPGLEIAWQGMGQLGLWTKPGAGFLCLEPWAGHADIAGWGETEFWQKPGLIFLAPGGSAEFRHRITLLG